MRQYEGPAYSNKELKPRSRRFNQPRKTEQRISTRYERSHFQPAFKRIDKHRVSGEENTQEMPNLLVCSENKQNHLKKESSFTKLPNVVKYDIPFVTQKEQIKDQTIDQQIKKHLEIQDKEPIIKKKSEKYKYKPSLRLAEEVKKQKVSRENEQKGDLTGAKRMTKPYQGTSQSKKIDQQTRLLAKRLAKSKESFLLFEY